MSIWYRCSRTGSGCGTCSCCWQKRGIITVTDAKHIITRLDDEKPEGVENDAVEQVAFADRLVLNKTVRAPAAAFRRTSFTAFVAGAGKLCVVGGSPDRRNSLTASELYDPTSDAWSAAAAAMATPLGYS